MLYMVMTGCRHFNGYKPCGKSEVCNESCGQFQIARTRILIIHLEALGAVLRSTALLAPIKRKFPDSHITWVTSKPGDQLLLGNPLVDRVVSFEATHIPGLSSMNFDVTFCIDKSFQATGLASQIQTDLLFGFKMDPNTGAILPANPAAEELWMLGLSNQKKFFENQKPETQLTCEALEIGPFQRDSYILNLNESEKKEAQQRRREWLSGGAKTLVGINTGCSNVISYKKLSIQAHRELVQKLSANKEFRVVLLGGKEDSLRNSEIAEGLEVIQSPTDRGLRDGIVSCAACDVIVSGDSLGMHIGIALKKWVVSWFGPTCSQEIDLYDRGEKVLSQASCGPCWKRICEKPTMCYDLVDLEQIYRAVLKRTRNGHESKDLSDSNSLHR